MDTETETAQTFLKIQSSAKKPLGRLGEILHGDVESFSAAQARDAGRSLFQSHTGSFRRNGKNNRNLELAKVHAALRPHGASGPPTRLEISVFLPGRGTVWLGPVKLVEYAGSVLLLGIVPLRLRDFQKRYAELELRKMSAMDA